MVLLIVCVWVCGAALMTLVFAIDDACKEIPGVLKPLLIVLWPGIVVGGLLLVCIGFVLDRRRR